MVAVQDENQSISAVLSEETAKTLSSNSKSVPLNLSLDSQIRQIALERDTLLKECQNLQDQLESNGSNPDFSSSTNYNNNNNPQNSSKYTRFYKKYSEDITKISKKYLEKTENYLESAKNSKILENPSFSTIRKSFRRKQPNTKDDTYHLKYAKDDKTNLKTFKKPAFSYSSLSDILKDPLVEHHIAEVKREAQREIADYKLRYHKAEQDIASLQATNNRQLGQVTRYKEQAEHYEAAEDNLKAERRKLTRENGQLKERVEELEITRDHLEKRFEKLRAARHLNNI